VKITPDFFVSFETNVSLLVVDAWSRMEERLVWDKFVEKRTSGTLRELFVWLVEAARIYPEGLGGNQRFDDLASAFFEITNTNSGASLRLTRNELEDNQKDVGNGRVMPVFDYAGNWASQVGGSAAYWPQEKFFQLVGSGKTKSSYDGVPFFSASHPVNPSMDVSPTYSNLLTAKPIGGTTPLDTAANNLAAVFAAIRGLRQPNGVPRNLKPRFILAGEDLRKRVYELTDSKSIIASGGTGGAGVGAVENVISARYGLEPVIAAELSEAGVYYIGVEKSPGEGGPFIYLEREGYRLDTYVPSTQVELARRAEFEWKFTGRNGASYGHPYLFFRVEPV